MKEYVPLISGFIGAIIGGAVSILTMCIQQHFQGKRDANRLAIETALKEYKLDFERGRILLDNPNTVKLDPIVSYVAYHVKLLELILSRKLTPETLRELGDYSRSIKSELAKADEGKAAH